jgi:hypothetical protein
MRFIMQDYYVRILRRPDKLAKRAEDGLVLMSNPSMAPVCRRQIAKPHEILYVMV